MANLHKDIGRIAFPAILSNITVPLLSLVDLSIVGHLGSATYIASISVGGTIFNMLYWIFAFLRMGTTGLTSQAFGQGNRDEISGCMIRALMVALSISILIILLQWPLRELLLHYMEPEEGVRCLASVYYNVCIWGAPAVLCQYALTGWFIGMQQARYPFYVALGQNIVNIACSLFFVYVWNYGMEGVACGTVVAQYAGLLLSVFYTIRLLKKTGRDFHLSNWRKYFTPKPLKRFFQVNRDIFLRTLCLVAVTTYFTSAGARQGEIILAMNTVMMQYFLIYSFFMDGIAYAGEALAGRFSGAKDVVGLGKCIYHLFQWGWVVTLLFTVLYMLGGTHFITMLTDNAEVVNEASLYDIWTIVIPVAGMAAFLWDGVFVGLTATRQMLIAMAVAMFIFFVLYFSLEEKWGNHALWLAFIAYLFVRGCVETLLYQQIKKSGK
ncbi:MAG: MATE family efflux transporter [Clostridium sp.]|nr:MATE family efflux transporter [Clostridium sp.]